MKKLNEQQLNELKKLISKAVNAKVNKNIEELNGHLKTLKAVFKYSSLQEAISHYKELSKNN